MNLKNDPYFKYIGQMNFGYFLPHPELRHFIRHYFFYEINSEIKDEPWNPISNGNIEMFIHFEGSYLTILEGGETKDYKAFLKGFYELGHDSWIIPRTNLNNCFKGVSIAFNYAGLEIFRYITGNNLLNRSIDIEDFVEHNFKGLLDIKTFDKVIISMLLDYHFRKLYNFFKRFSKHKMNHLFNEPFKSRGKLDLCSLSQEFNISYRTIHRLFDRDLGFCPKKYLKALRFNRACEYLKYKENIDWTELIFNCGYYDQSHFIREFKNVMNETPSEFLKKTGRNFYLNSAYTF